MKSLPGESTTPGATSSVKLGTSKPDPGGVLYMTYAEQLKSPKWQKKRLEILERDKFTCQWCGTQSDQLHVHHYFYFKDCEIWDYEDIYLITVCNDCHEWLHIKGDIIKNLLAHLFSKNDIGMVMDFLMECRIDNDFFLKCYISSKRHKRLRTKDMPF